MSKSLFEIEQDSTSSRPRPDLRPGDTVRVHARIKEGSKTRVQIYEGTVIALKHGGPRETVTVRKISNGVGVERIFPLYSALVERFEVKSRHRVRRAKLYYLRDLSGKSARLKEIKSWHRGDTAKGVSQTGSDSDAS